MTAVTLTFSIPDFALGKGKKRSRARKRDVVKEKRVSTGPNFLLDEWLHDCRLSVRSHSVGRANHGRVHNAVLMDPAGRSWKFLPAIKKRGTLYGTEALIQLLSAASDAVAEQFPGTEIEIGNIGLEKGGKILQSKSHQAGRDVDVAFPALDPKGRRRPAGRFLPFDPTGNGPGGWKLDVERTWAFIKHLLSSHDPAVQWIFVSNGIRELILAHAREKGEPASMINRASVVLHQPSDSSDHRDHMHIRIHCTSWDLAHGCEEYGPPREHWKRDNSLREERIEQLTRRAKMGLINERLAALKELLSLGDPGTPALLKEFLCDADPAVVREAAAILDQEDATRTEQHRIAALGCSKSPEGLLVLFEPLATLRDATVWRTARTLASKPYCISGSGTREEMRLCALGAESLGYSTNLSVGPLLAALLDSKDKKVSNAALRAIRTLYAAKAPVGPGSKGKGKRGWAELANKFKKRSWLSFVSWQLKRQGYRVSAAMDSPVSKRELLRAVKAGFPVSYSAQVILSGILGVQLPRPLSPAKATRVLAAALGRLPPLPD